jgi:DNA-binding transcriptional regulator LsrR (DeoR family)
MERRLLITIAQMYYEKDLTQKEIAAALGLSRIKVSRAIQKAKELGIVKVTIESGSFNELEARICEKFSLRDALVTENFIGDNAKKQIGNMAATYLETALSDHETIAVGWGTTVKEASNYFDKIEKRDLLFVPIIGGHGVTEMEIHASSVASNMARLSGGKALALNAPALAETMDEKAVLMRNPFIKEVLAKTSGANAAIFSLGSPLHEDSSMHRIKYCTHRDFEEMRKNQVVCDMISIAFLDREGHACCELVSDRSIGIAVEALKAIPLKVCLVEGESKKNATLAALKGGFIDVLITDKATAEFILEEI